MMFREILKELCPQVTLCPWHETACEERLVDAGRSTVLVKSRLWLELAEADRSRNILSKVFSCMQ